MLQWMVTGLVILSLLVYFSIRSMWTAISKPTFEKMPYILLVVQTVLMVGSVLFLANGTFPIWYAVLASAVSAFYLFMCGKIIKVTAEASPYFVRQFTDMIKIFAVAAIACFMIVGAKTCELLHNSWVVALLFFAILFVGIKKEFDLTLVNGFKYDPVVYAVGNTYQIVFVTRAKGMAWVTIDGVEYSDTHAGSRKTESRVHKVIVPMEVLDKAKEYKLTTKAMILRGPYCAYQGKEFHKTYTWKGVRAEKELKYYVLSDTHVKIKAPTNAAGFFGDELDFLIMAGDHINWSDKDADLELIVKLAAKVTKGQIPAVYARGNHETKGSKSCDLYKYVGADGENYYYTFRLGKLWGIVLDTGEDYREDFFEYYGTAKFDAYRDMENEFIDRVLANADTEFNAPGVEYRIAISHAPLTVQRKEEYIGPYLDRWVEALDEMKITMMYAGHIHELWYVDPAWEAGTELVHHEAYCGTIKRPTYYMAKTNVPTVGAGRRGVSQCLMDRETPWDKYCLGIAAVSNGETTTIQFTNEKQEVIQNIMSPWFADVNYGDRIVVKNVK